MTVNTIDELDNEKYDEAEKAIIAFQGGSKNREQEHILYDILTNLGISSEGADELINLLLS